MTKLSGIGKLSLTQKMCLAGLFTALATILQKVLAINYLAALPFFRISFGAPAIIVFASIFLGPIWGAAVGAFSDILGYFAFDASGYAFMPLITLIYLVLGLAGFFVYKFVNKIKSDKLIFIIEIAFLTITFVGVSCYLIFFYPAAKTIEKTLIPVGLFILLTLLVLFQFFANKENSKFHAPIKISFTYFLLDLFVLVLFGSLMKAFSFSTDPNSFGSLFKTILITQGFVMIFNVVFNTILLSTFFRLTKKYME